METGDYTGRDLTANDVRDAQDVGGYSVRATPAEIAACLNRIARPSSRSWSLPAPPPDDVTVVHVGGVRFDRDLDMWRDRFVPTGRP